MADCQACKGSKQEIEPIPYIAHESAMARAERTIKRLWIALLVSICLWAVTVAGIIYYEAQFADEVVTVESNTDDGGTAIANANGELTYYGAGECND